MNTLKKLQLTLALILCATVTALAAKPNIHILATGGTIAGTGSSATTSQYTAGQVAIGTLLDAVPQIKDIANVTGEQIVSIGSQDMNDQVWLTLANRINELLASPECDGIVVTHGTDTMEETAYFLNLTVHSDKPVVLTGAMRPSTAMSADGPLNLYNSVVTAASKDSYGRGVMIVMNGLILGAHSTQKMNTVDVQTFQAPDAGPLGYVYNSRPYYNMQTQKRHTTQSVFDVKGLK
ncbi:MAG: type II asparaginase, partial [Porphyromonadaceae bacterium]|nr:type II asparaginase [Porphyromonadaceae bacterium]